MNHIPVAIHLTHPEDPALQAKSRWFMAQPGCTFQTDSSQPIPILHLTRQGTFLEAGEDRLHFHPNLAILRIMQSLRGHPDRFLTATQLQPGQTFLDATLGLGTDALVAAWKAGESGKVIAIEHSPLIAALMKEGFEAFGQRPLPPIENPDKRKAWQELIQASRRIEVIWGDHKERLAQLPADTVDVVYFDPMFRHTRAQSSSIHPLHTWSDHRPLQMDVVHDACRVARSRVVLKERKGSSEFARLGFHVLNGGRYSQVDYGIIHCTPIKEEPF